MGESFFISTTLGGSQPPFGATNQQTVKQMQPTIKQLRARAAEYGMEIEQVCERVKRDDDGTPREPKWELHAPRGKAFRDGPRSYVSADLEQLKADIDDAIIDGFENA